MAVPRGTDSVLFVDRSALVTLGMVADVPDNVVALVDGHLGDAAVWLSDYPWLSHVISTSMFEHAMSSSHLGNVVSALASGTHGRLLDWVRPTLQGQRIRLTHASERTEQLDEMVAFFVENGISKDTSQQLRAGADELLVSAFYDAPFAAGAVSKPIPRTLEVVLPESKACDIVYGLSDDFVIVRVRDPFGSLSRGSIVDAIRLRSGFGKVVDTASFVAVSVARDHHSDVLIGITKHAIHPPRPFAVHMFFRDSGKRRVWKLVDEDSNQRSFASFGDAWDES